MKFSVIASLATLGCAAAFAPAPAQRMSSVAMNAESQTRKAFLGAVAVFAGVPIIANAASMQQENISDPTERWETGSPTPKAESARLARYTNARTQMTSNYPPQKRLVLERKSPVTRLDINSPNFGAYKRTYPGLFRNYKSPEPPSPPVEQSAEPKKTSTKTKDDTAKSAKAKEITDKAKAAASGPPKKESGGTDQPKEKGPKPKDVGTDPPNVE